MITIQCIHTSSGIEPGRRLTDTEKSTVTSVLSDGFQFIYYQGDEPITQPIIEPIDQPIIEQNPPVTTISLFRKIFG